MNILVLSIAFPSNELLGYFHVLLTERRGTVNRFPGIVLGPIPWLWSDAPAALKDPNRELLFTCIENGLTYGYKRLLKMVNG